MNNENLTLKEVFESGVVHMSEKIQYKKRLRALGYTGIFTECYECEWIGTRIDVDRDMFNVAVCPECSKKVEVTV